MTRGIKIAAYWFAALIGLMVLQKLLLEWHIPQDQTYRGTVDNSHAFIWAVIKVGILVGAGLIAYLGHKRLFPRKSENTANKNKEGDHRPTGLEQAPNKSKPSAQTASSPTTQATKALSTNPPKITSSSEPQDKSNSDTAQSVVQEPDKINFLVQIASTPTTQPTPDLPKEMTQATISLEPKIGTNLDNAQSNAELLPYYEIALKEAETRRKECPRDPGPVSITGLDQWQVQHPWIKGHGS